MKDRSNGSACPFQGRDVAGRVSSQSDNPRFSATTRAALRTNNRPRNTSAARSRPALTTAPPLRAPASARGRQAKRRRRTWIERAGQTPATTPMWTSRAAWLSALSSWATDDVITAVATRLGCSITSATVLRVAAAMAEYADHATGRHVAVTRATLAQRIGCSSRTITTAWHILRDTGWAVEASRGHGGPRTPAFGRRPSVWHLTPRRRAVQFFHLPPLSRESGSSPERSYSPRAHACAAAQASPKRRRPHRNTPRPLTVQKLAAQLVALCHGLHRGHIGSVCDAITTAGIDPGLWTAQNLKSALDRDAQQTHWSWPDRIERPGAFLVGRLRRLTAAGVAPAAPVAPTQVVPARPAEPASMHPPALQSTIATAQTTLRRHLAGLREHPAAAAQGPDRRPQKSRAVAVADFGYCSCCGAPDAPRRAHMPASRAHICPTCWTG